MPLPPLVALVGPTAVGKTTLSLALSQRFAGEVVSADSRQIYRGLDIGTDKAPPAVRAAVPHHLIDVVDPDEVLTLAEYQRAAYRAIDSVHGRGRLPLLVGGSGLYVRAVMEGLGIPEVPPHPALRAELEAFAGAQGIGALHARLRALDPDAAARIDPRNVRRVVRALEVCLVTGRPISRLQQASPPPYRLLWIGLIRPRPSLYARIDHRVERMLEEGLVAETQALLDRGLSPDLPAFTGLGYHQIIQHLQGEITLEEAVAAIKRQTRRFVRQQGTWFRQDDRRIRWFDLEEVDAAAVARVVEQFLGEGAEGPETPGTRNRGR